MLRGALAQLLELEEDIEIVGEVANGDEALDMVRRYAPDILIADIEMPGLSGLDVAERLKQRPASTQVVIVTTFARPGYLERAMRAGVSGYILKDEPIDRLIDHLRRIQQGERYISPELAVHFYFTRENPLTGREIDVLRAAETGERTQQIANRLHLSRGTVRNYLSTAIQKMDAISRQEAVRKAKDQGWI
ncbi:MAG: response regulator transcription factor [Sporolactobacillus sp.]|jgi:two-component system response regulator DesR|nr:response regulator transcription factor [Sporolactobacillus sp.]MCI1881742.1 response regulator transcription factor [Sporolactobacillus sp.]